MKTPKHYRINNNNSISMIIVHHKIGVEIKHALVLSYT